MVAALIQTRLELIGEKTGVPRNAHCQVVLLGTRGIPDNRAEEVEEDDRHYERPQQRFAPAQQVRRVHTCQIECVSKHGCSKQTFASGVKLKGKETILRRPCTRPRSENPWCERIRRQTL